MAGRTRESFGEVGGSPGARDGTGFTGAATKDETAVSRASDACPFLLARSSHRRAARRSVARPTNPPAKT